MVRYSKKSADILQVKSDFILNNKKYLDECEKIYKVWQEQPERKKCKICNCMLNKNRTFKSHGYKYYICSTCGHVNGEYSDTDDFSTRNYDIFYNEKTKIDYLERVKKIYIPKFKFLIDSLKEDGYELEKFKLLDIGAGSGYFVNAGLLENYNCQGIEISKTQVKFANKIMNSNLECVPAENVVRYIENADATCVSAIGVLEHIINLHEVLKSIVKNKNIKYLYFSVPLFSFSCIIESIFEKVYNRLLSGSHTHIFTFESIEYLNKMYGFKEVSRWHFGTDMVDLYRSFIVSMEDSENYELEMIFKNKYLKLIDSLQEVIDKNNLGSEVHMLVKIERQEALL